VQLRSVQALEAKRGSSDRVINKQTVNVTFNQAC